MTHLDAPGVDEVDGLHDLRGHGGHLMPGGRQRGPGGRTHHDKHPGHGQIIIQILSRGEKQEK